jgi:hypothetical protein
MGCRISPTRGRVWTTVEEQHRSTLPGHQDPRLTSDPAQWKSELVDLEAGLCQQPTLGFSIHPFVHRRHSFRFMLRFA